MARNGANFVFLVEDGQQLHWVTKNSLIRSHPQALIDFYESHIEVYELSKPEANEAIKMSK
jgi:hypothetical protein